MDMAKRKIHTGDIYIGPTSFKIVNSIENITESI